MILSNQDIIDFVAAEKLHIDGFAESMLGSASYKLTLGENLLRPVGNDIIDFQNGLLPEYEEIRITEEGYVLQPEEFILGQTSEKLSLSNEICAQIEGRSSLARTGLEVVMTSTFIEPSHKESIVTLELKNNGKSPFMLRARMPIAKIFFYLLKSPSVEKHQNEVYKTQTEVEPPNTKPYKI